MKIFNYFSTVELERIISDAQGLIYYGAHTLSELIGEYKCPTLSKNGRENKLNEINFNRKKNILF